MAQENQNNTEVTGMVLQSTPIGEYDRRVVLLTRERGRISAFARGARRPGNPLMAAASPFCFGKFSLYEGRNSYVLRDASIGNYFESIRVDVEKTCYASYFMEILSYYTRENNDETMPLILGYFSLRALENERIGPRLVRCIFEIKMVMIEGEYPGKRPDRACSETLSYTLEYIGTHEISKLYSFTLSDEALAELEEYCEWMCSRVFRHHFTSLEILGMLRTNVEKRK